MALRGNLQDFNATQLFNLINLARKTGTLTVDARDAEARLGFREGKLLFAAVDGQQDRLVTVLERAGKLSKEQAQAVSTQAGERSDKELGLMLINAGFVNRTDIMQSVRNHTLNNVYRMFTWSDGSFRFDSGVLPFADRVTVPIDLENVIVEGSRRLKEWEHLQEELPDLDVALQFAERPGARIRSISLSVDEWRVISFINPRNTIRQIAQHNGLTDQQIRKLVYGLLQAGLVEIVQPAGALPAPVAAPSPVPARALFAAGAAAPAPAHAASRSARVAEAPPAVRRPDVKRGVILRLIDRIRNL
jgi:hypothetical protein